MVAGIMAFKGMLDASGAIEALPIFSGKAASPWVSFFSRFLSLSVC
jgi:hypothetical protein